MTPGLEFPSPGGGMAERFHRRVLSIATFVQVGRRMEKGASFDRVYRRLLLTAMAATDRSRKFATDNRNTSFCGS